MFSSFKTIQVSVNNHLATITLNRPEIYNAINSTLARELKMAFDKLSDFEPVKVIILTGAGTAFCSGQDLNEFENPEDISVSEVLQARYNPLIMSMHNCPKVIIGKINGIAAGAGLSLALACDFLVAIESAIFTCSFVNIALVPDCGATYFLPRLVGRAKAFELCTMGYRFSARDAHNIGMINVLVEHENILHRKVNELAERYAHSPTKTIGLIKQLLNKSFGHSLDKMLEKEAIFQESLVKTEDFKEGIKAFREKRQPDFSGK